MYRPDFEVEGPHTRPAPARSVVTTLVLIVAGSFIFGAVGRYLGVF